MVQVREALSGLGANSLDTGYGESPQDLQTQWMGDRGSKEGAF